MTRFKYWLSGFAYVADGLVTVLSFGFLSSSFSLVFGFWLNGIKVGSSKIELYKPNNKKKEAT